MAGDDFSLKSLDLNKVKGASLVLKGLDNPFRIKILSILNKHGHLCVTDLVMHTESEQSMVSIHLAILRRYNIVKTTRIGNQIFYELNCLRLMEINNFLHCLLKTD